MLEANQLNGFAADGRAPIEVVSSGLVSSTLSPTLDLGTGPNRLLLVIARGYDYSDTVDLPSAPSINGESLTSFTGEGGDTSEFWDYNGYYHAHRVWYGRVTSTGSHSVTLAPVGTSTLRTAYIVLKNVEDPTPIEQKGDGHSQTGTYNTTNSILATPGSWSVTAGSNFKSSGGHLYDSVHDGWIKRTTVDTFYTPEVKVDYGSDGWVNCWIAAHRMPEADTDGYAGGYVDLGMRSSAWDYPNYGAGTPKMLLATFR